MIGEKLLELRKIHRFTQEDVAEKIGVSRQTIAKWENNESIPDMMNGNKLAKLYNVSLDDIVNAEESDEYPAVGPKGKHIFGTVRMDAKGRIEIPEKARKMFHLSDGTEIVVLGDIAEGIALMDAQKFFDRLKYVNDQAIKSC